ncbi:hypothetical protein D8674_022335 [Pyrus ussuriensis x Pyrus communis]|uniref:Transcription elongation factor 1 homolog n=1 Tax=Pyrus ussuriensis x Pyrus communis TaxID=2448454 RepID=A0A5N5GKU5_9ROSA|nr:hypothetical protein D8674_022335 [Pyrus ussuriensis x Pyrus communis]
MGTKRSPAAAKKRPTEKQLKTVFCCPFCYQGSCVECSVCLASYDTTTTSLTKPIDVYKECLDKYGRTLDQ